MQSMHPVIIGNLGKQQPFVQNAAENSTPEKDFVLIAVRNEINNIFYSKHHSGYRIWQNTDTVSLSLQNIDILCIVWTIDQNVKLKYNEKKRNCIMWKGI